jgi:hypothetical protein
MQTLAEEQEQEQEQAQGQGKGPGAVPLVASDAAESVDTTYLHRKRHCSELSFDLFSRPSTNLINALNGVSVGMPSQAAHDRSGTTIKMVTPMNCLICVGVAERIQCSGPWEEGIARTADVTEFRTTLF